MMELARVMNYCVAPPKTQRQHFIRANALGISSGGGGSEMKYQLIKK